MCRPPFVGPGAVSLVSFSTDLIILATSEEYKLLEQMNVISKDKYAGMTQNTVELVKAMEDLQRKCTYIKPFISYFSFF